MYQQPYYPPKQHHYIEWIVIVILLAIIGVGGYHIFHTPTGHNITQQAASKIGKKNQQSASSNNNSPTTQTTNHTNNVTQSKTDQSKSIPQNKPGYTLAVFPKNIQGTWYSYDEGKLDTLVITPTSASFNGHAATIHARPKNATIPQKMNGKTKNWATAIPCNVRGIHFSEVRGWAQSAGDGVSYGVFNDNGTVVLDEAGGAEFTTDANFFKNKALAKQNKKKVFKNHGEKSDNLN